jgi:hypothetical protein
MRAFGRRSSRQLRLGSDRCDKLTCLKICAPCVNEICLSDCPQIEINGEEFVLAEVRDFVTRYWLPCCRVRALRRWATSFGIRQLGSSFPAAWLRQGILQGSLARGSGRPSCRRIENVRRYYFGATSRYRVSSSVRDTRVRDGLPQVSAVMGVSFPAGPCTIDGELHRHQDLFFAQHSPAMQEKELSRSFCESAGTSVAKLSCLLNNSNGPSSHQAFSIATNDRG